MSIPKRKYSRPVMIGYKTSQEIETLLTELLAEYPEMLRSALYAQVIDAGCRVLLKRREDHAEKQ